jgi:hypothetical protein
VTIIEAARMSQLMKKFVGNRCCLGLLRFFAIHPNGRFSHLAVVHAIDEAGSRLEVEKSLKQMADEGILVAISENGNVYYVLTKEEEMRRLILNMALFDWRDWQLVLEHV